MITEGIADGARDSRESSEIGRRARVELVFERQGDRTVLTHGYAEPPFRVGRAFTEGDGLHLIMASSAPGMFGGDAFEQVIRVGPGARVRLTSQSAMQVHASVEGMPASVRSTYSVDDGGLLQCHWDPIIPFAGVRFSQHVDIALHPLARVYWSDAFMSGRVGSVPAERWAFQSLAYDLRVSRAGITEYLERYAIVPHDTPARSTWTTDDANYFGTTLLSGWRLTADYVEHCHRALAGLAGVRAAADLLEPALVVSRVMAREGVPFHECRDLMLRILMSGNDLALVESGEEVVKTS